MYVLISNFKSSVILKCFVWTSKKKKLMLFLLFKFNIKSCNAAVSIKNIFFENHEFPTALRKYL